MTPRSITFIQQDVEDVKRNASLGGLSRYHSHTSSISGSSCNSAHSDTPLVRTSGRLSPLPSSPSSPPSYGAHLSLFVIFDKKAGWIRLADSAAGEIDLYDSQQHNRDSCSSKRRSRSSFEGLGIQGKGLWALPVRAELPVPPSHGSPSTSLTVHLLTRGKITHIVPSPLPANVAQRAPLRVITWEYAPTHITPRVCHPPGEGTMPYLQLVALGEDGVEVQEISLGFLSKGKSKGRAEEVRKGQADVGGATGFLCVGGHWDEPNYPYQQAPSLLRSYSASSGMSGASVDTMATEDIESRMRMEEGVYGWCRKGVEDWRVFWVGGSSADGDNLFTRLTI